MKLYSAAVFISAVTSSEATNLSVGDLRRAKAKVPGTSFKGSSFAHSSSKLNKALERSSAAPMLVACADLSVDQLQETMAALIETRTTALSEVYGLTSDARALRHSGLKGYQEEWAVLTRAATSPDLSRAAHDMMCHEAVMLYVHHQTAQQQAALALEGKIMLPKLPVGERLFNKITPNTTMMPEARFVVDAYLKSTGCAACHTDQDGLKPDTASPTEAPRWPPAAEPVIPWRWSADLGGWMDMGGKRTNFSGSFHYDYALNRLKEHWVVANMGMEIINYWFGSPGPDAEQAEDLPKGAKRGHIYQVMTMGGNVLSCKDDTYPTFSIVRPDSFIKQWHNDASNLHYVARENMADEDMGGARGWADHWTYADSCGNFSLWVGLDSGLPVYTRGPTGCNSGNAGNSYLNHTLAPPPDSLFQFNFSVCKPGNTSASIHKALWGSPIEAMQELLVV